MKPFTPIAAAALLAAAPMFVAAACAETISPDGSDLPDLITPDTISPDTSSPDMVSPGSLAPDLTTRDAVPAASDESLPDTSIITAATSGKSAGTDSFVTTAASANAFEIQTSRMAEKEAAAKDVRTFAKEMIRDHERIGKHFEAALGKGKLAPPSGPTLSTEDQSKLEELNGLKGKEFDAKYVELQAAAHHDAVALFSGYAKSGDNKALRSFAKDTLPVLEMHEKHIDRLEKAYHS